MRDLEWGGVETAEGLYGWKTESGLDRREAEDTQIPQHAPGIPQTHEALATFSGEDT